MIAIDKAKFSSVETEFYESLSSYLKMKVKTKKSAKLATKHQSKVDKWIEAAEKDDKDSILADMFRFYKDNWTRISAIDSVKSLWKINNEFNSKFFREIIRWGNAINKDQDDGSGKELKKNTSFGKFQIKMKSVYDGFFKSNKAGYENFGEWMADSLGIICCPYCNRHYTFTIKKNDDHQTVRPQFDHFLPKSLFPLTAVCFFNLLPACPECNTLKSDDLISIHPYESSFESEGIKFSYDPTSDLKNPLIGINDEENENVKVLALKDLYQKHSDIAADLINKAKAYNAFYYDSLVRSFPGLGMTQNEIDRAVWGVSLEEKDMINRPFSKFTRDILDQLGIVH